jgi:hypothetical protein
MFSGQARPQDAIVSGPLNATKIITMITVIATAVAAASKPLFGTDGPFHDLTPGQRLILWLGVLGLVAVVVAVDTYVRGRVTGNLGAASESAPIVWFNPTRRVSNPGAGGDPGGSAVALRPSNEDSSGIQYLVVRDPAAGEQAGAARQTAWVGASLLMLT